MPIGRLIRLLANIVSKTSTPGGREGHWDYERRNRPYPVTRELVHHG
jgi:hypothetical protein